MATGGYSFGTSATAAARLWHLGRVFEPTMRSVLAELPARRWETVVDLGCGPGASSATLADALDIGRLVGVDASTTFLAEAATKVPDLEPVLADATAPLPVHGPDLIYARYLLAHLPDPLVALARWRSQLAVGGLVAIEDLVAIDTPVPVFAEYLELADGLVASRGAAMYVGQRLIGVDDEAVVLHRTVELEVSAADAARLFLSNLASWRDDPWVRSQRSARGLDDLAGRLAEAARDDRRTTTWHLRQIVAGAR